MKDNYSKWYPNSLMGHVWRDGYALVSGSQLVVLKDAVGENYLEWHPGGLCVIGERESVCVCVCERETERERGEAERERERERGREKIRTA